MTKPITGLGSSGSLSGGGIGINVDGIVTTRAAQPPIQVARWARNGKHPNAMLQNMIDQQINQAAMYRGAEVFRACGGLSVLGDVAGSRPRYRFAFHTGPYTRYVQAVVRTSPPKGIDPSGSDGYTQIDLTDASAVTSSTTFHAGYSTLATTPWDASVEARSPIVVTPDTEYTALVSDVNYSCCFSICLYQLVSLSELGPGYLVENLSALSPIYADYRQNAATILRNLWRRGGWPVLHWNATSSDTGQAPGRSTTSRLDLMNCWPNGASNSTDWGGYELDLTGHARRSQIAAGVPIRVRAYGTNQDAFNPGGNVGLAIAPSGLSETVVWQTGNLWAPGETAWHTLDTVMPASAGKYHLQFADNGGNNGFQLYAVSVYGFEP